LTHGAGRAVALTLRPYPGEQEHTPGPARLLLFLPNACDLSSYAGLAHAVQLIAAKCGRVSFLLLLLGRRAPRSLASMPVEGAALWGSVTLVHARQPG
jgi:NAD(P)-dependent dehydrogenase (short-subunit alcohol dehydrogenase family)